MTQFKHSEEPGKGGVLGMPPFFTKQKNNRNNMKNDSKLAQFYPNDIVEIEFKHYGNDKRLPFQALILSEHKRFGSYEGIKSRQNPLIKYKNLETGEVSSCDKSYVIKLIKKGTREHVYTNIYKDRKGIMWKISKGIYAGSLRSLIEHCIGNIDNQNILTEVDYTKAHNLYRLQQCPGLVRKDSHILFVRMKYFKPWVEKNYLKFLTSHVEMDKRETAYIKEMDDKYYDSLEIYR